ncbi:MAG: hypothetical protein JKX76_11240 [Colwellia sp.]|nr:hypothetical protein [Colwellia sp.]
MEESQPKKIDQLPYVREVISLFLQYFHTLDIKPLVHFELEGSYKPSYPTLNKNHTLDYAAINSKLAKLGILGQLKSEYWTNQWEYVSDFAGQSPLKEADDLAHVISILPALLAKFGAAETLIKPVVWSGDNGKLAFGCQHIFTNENRMIHIPNAIQINVSSLNVNGENMLVEGNFGDCLQQSFLSTSYSCALLFLPEEEAFARLELKTKFGLANELCSPVDISGGHQGSIALYRQIGKHNQPMGVTPLLYGTNEEVLVSQQDWHATARVEHRLGATSVLYDPHLNVIFALANLSDALTQFNNEESYSNIGKETVKLLPTSLYRNKQDAGAIALFANDNWFSNKINQIQQKCNDAAFSHFPDKVGDIIKSKLLIVIEK